MKNARQSILEDRFPDFVRKFIKEFHPDCKYPRWVQEALASVNIQLDGADPLTNIDLDPSSVVDDIVEE